MRGSHCFLRLAHLRNEDIFQRWDDALEDGRTVAVLVELLPQRLGRGARGAQEQVQGGAGGLDAEHSFGLAAALSRAARGSGASTW